MAQNKVDKKEIILTVLLLLGGAALTATSFCVYYLVKPRNTAVLIVLCVVDLLYTAFSTCIACKNLPTEKWLLKGIGVAVGYIVVFIIVALLFFVFNEAYEMLKNNIIAVVYYAFFTGPCIFIVMALALLFLCGLSV